MQNNNSSKRFFECELENGRTIRFRLNRTEKTAAIIRKATATYCGSVVIPSTIAVDGIAFTVTAIDDDAFRGCTGLTSINVDSSNPNYSSEAGVLFDKNKTTLIHYPQGKAGAYTVPDSVTVIDNCAFYECESLTSINVGSNNPKYSSEAGVLFDKNKTTLIRCPQGKTGKYIIPDSVIDIDGWAFYGCENLTSINVDGSNPNYSSEDSVLFDKNKTTLICCPAWKAGTYTIPDSVIDIDTCAFNDCKNLTSITVPAGVTDIGFGVFLTVPNLTSINVDSSNPNYSSETGVLFDKNKTTLIRCPQGKTGTYTIPAGVDAICDDAFYRCEDLTLTVDSNNPNYSSEAGVLFDKNKTTLIRYPAWKTGSYTVPAGVIAIGDDAFMDCKSLTSIIIPAGVTVIGVNAFMGCCSLTSVTIPDSVTVIDEFAFWYCDSLTSVTVPDSVTDIGGCAFGGCISLMEIHNRRATPQIISDYVFDGVDKSINKDIRQTCILYVPESAVAVYKSAPVWKSFANIVGEI